MNAFTGTWRLFRLSLRLDRIKLPIWIIANAGIVALTIPQLQSTYHNEAQRLLYANATAPSAVTRLLGGALTGPSIGEITVIETYVLIILLIALMNIFLIIRHTRQNEETNRSEMIESAVVGRQAQLTAALLLAFCANIVTVGLIFAALVQNDLPMAGSVLYSLGIFLNGLFFAGVAAITAQLYENTRAASGMAGLVFGILFLVRGVGDAFGKLGSSGVSVKTNIVSWLSPVGWTTGVRPYADDLWWGLSFFAIAIPMTIIAAYALLNKRDVGSSIFTSKPGRLHAKPQLLRTFGLTWRLNKTAFIAWLISFATIGAILGAVADSFQKLIAGNEEMQKTLATLGGDSDITNIMFSAMFTIAGIAATGYGLQILTRMRSEETTGRLEVLLSTKKSRPEWLSIHVLFALVTVVILLVVTGLFAGLAFGIATDAIVSNIAKLGAATLVHLPAACVLMGASLVLFGVIPRLFIPLTWMLLASCLLIYQLRIVLNLPQWVVNISPFAHTPPALGNSLSFKPLLIQTGVAVFLFIIGFIAFRRRDLTTE